LIKISDKPGLAVNRQREITARPRQRLDERCPTKLLQIVERVFALVTGGAMGTVPVMQKEIFAAQRRNAGALQNFVGEIFVRRQRRGGGVVLRIPGAAPGAEMNGFAI